LAAAIQNNTFFYWETGIVFSYHLKKKEQHSTHFLQIYRVCRRFM